MLEFYLRHSFLLPPTLPSWLGYALCTIGLGGGLPNSPRDACEMDVTWTGDYTLVKDSALVYPCMTACVGIRHVQGSIEHLLHRVACGRKYQFTPPCVFHRAPVSSGGAQLL